MTTEHKKAACIGAAASLGEGTAWVGTLPVGAEQMQGCAFDGSGVQFEVQQAMVIGADPVGNLFV